MKHKQFCENPFCESPAVKQVPVSVNKPGDEKRWFCVACGEAYMIGRQHARKTAEAMKLQPYPPLDAKPDDGTIQNANPRLIAAAAELLSALNKLLFWMETPETAERSGVKWRDVLPEARAAITKATEP